LRRAPGEAYPCGRTVVWSSHLQGPERGGLHVR